jgi:hypothetical protein
LLAAAAAVSILLLDVVLPPLISAPIPPVAVVF